MHIRSILAIARKDARDIILNKATLALLAMPVLLAVLFAILGALLGGHKTTMLIYNPGRSGVEQVLKSAFSDYQVTYAGSPQDVTAAFGPDGSHKDTAYAVGLTVAPDFEAALRSGRHPTLQLYIDGNQVNDTVRALLQDALANYARVIVSPQPPASVSVATVNPPSPSHGLQNIGQLYAITALLSSFVVGTSLVPGLLVEEKEKKTLRMLMVAPASYGDVIVAKLLVGLAYQFLLTALAVAITNGFATNAPVMMLFALLGGVFSVSLGLLIGSFISTTNAAGAFCGTLSFLYILPVFGVGPFLQLIGTNAFTQFLRVLPTYYIADGTANAVLNTLTPGNLALDVGVTLGCIAILFTGAVWILRGQAALVSMI